MFSHVLLTSAQGENRGKYHYFSGYSGMINSTPVSSGLKDRQTVVWPVIPEISCLFFSLTFNICLTFNILAYQVTSVRLQGLKKWKGEQRNFNFNYYSKQMIKPTYPAILIGVGVV